MLQAKIKQALQAKERALQAKVKKGRDKKGISVMIGYILLISLAVVMSIIVYQWIKTYIPKDVAKCPDGVSAFMKEIKYTCTIDGKSNTLDITLKNNGKFNIAGYFIHVTEKEAQELATTDISNREIISGGSGDDGVVLFNPPESTSTELDVLNSLAPGGEIKTSFQFLAGAVRYYKVEIIPVRYEKKESKLSFLSCSSAKVAEALTCS